LFFITIHLQGSYTTSFNVFRKLVNNGINLRLHNRVVILRSPDTIKKAVILTCFLPYFVTRSSIMSDKQLDDNDWDPLDPDSLKNQRQTYDEQIVSILRNWTAGHGTVVAGLSIILLHLAEDFDLQNLLRNEPARIPAVIEEILRVDGSLVANRRTTTQDVEIQDKKILKGESISLMWIAANRDPRVFDDAESIQVNREMKDGMVWGQGIHDCMGAPLARLEIRIALEELLSRTKQFSLSSTSPIRSIYPSNGLESLFLQFN